MIISRSRITSQGQISVPADVRRKLGVGPGSILEWDEEDGKIVVRRSGKYTSQDIRDALFKGKEPPHKTLEELKEGVRKYIVDRYGPPKKRR